MAEIRRTLAIDPGANMGWAIFSARGRLEACGVGAKSLEAHSTPFEWQRVVVERPMIYPGARQKARPRDVITLALRAGERAGLYGLRYGVTPEYFEPDEWKGGPVPKEVNHQRTWTKLDAREQDVLRQAAASVAKGRHHDMLDAVGIGLFGIGR